MLFKEGPSYEVIEADPDVHLELDEKGKIMGIGFLRQPTFHLSSPF